MAIENKQDIDSLAKRIEKLEQKVGLLVSIADNNKYPFIYKCLEADMTADQVDRTLVLINKAEQSFRTKNPVSYAQFEKELLEIVPSQKRNADFTKELIRALVKKDQFYKGYKRFRREGIDI